VISGIGATYKSRLIAAGIITAADIDWRVNRVYGIGPTKQSALVAWRQMLENDARRTAPTLSLQERSAIENNIVRRGKTSRQRDSDCKRNLMNKSRVLANILLIFGNH